MMESDDPHGVAALIDTALYDDGGESIEGAFVDRWVANAESAREELVEIFRQHGFGERDRARLQAVMRSEDVRQDRVVELVIALVPHTQPLISEMLADPSPSARAVALLAQARLLGARLAHERLLHIRPDGIDDMAAKLRAALQDPSPTARVAAVRAIGEQFKNIPAANDLLITALTDRDPRVRYAAVETVRFYRHPAGGQALLRTLATESDPLVRRAIVRIVAETTAREGIHVSAPTLEEGIGPGIKALLIEQIHHRDPKIREVVFRALQRLRGEAVATALFERLLVETDALIRQLLVLYLHYEVIAERALPIFADLLAHDPDPLVRMRVAWLLESFGPRVMPLLIEALADAGPRRAAAMTLVRVGDVRALPALTRELANAENRAIRNDLIGAIRDILLAARPRPPLPDLAAYIQGEIDALQPRTLGEWPLRVCKEELNALPLHSSLLFIWALRPDGTLLCMDHEAFGHPTEVETDPFIRFVALVKGARRYPPLHELVPLPPRGTAVCLTCNATGFNDDPKAANQGCSNCGGAGWLRGRE